MPPNLSYIKPLFKSKKTNKKKQLRFNINENDFKMIFKLNKKYSEKKTLTRSETMDQILGLTVEKQVWQKLKPRFSWKGCFCLIDTKQ